MTPLQKLEKLAEKWGGLELTNHSHSYDLRTTAWIIGKDRRLMYDDSTAEKVIEKAYEKEFGG